MNDGFHQKMKEVLMDNQILIEEPMARHTTFQVGGPAKFLLLPESAAQVSAIISICRDEHMPYYVIGNGSNLLVSDKGYEGTIVKLHQSFSEIVIEEAAFSLPDGLDSKITANIDVIPVINKPTVSKKYIVQAQSGVLLAKLASSAAEYGLTGLEFAAGIPGTLGGAVTMNAGAYGGEIKQCILRATVLDQDGNIKVLGKEELKLGYRKSIIQTNHYIVLDAAFLLEKSDIEEIKNKIKDYNSRRREKQPLEYPSAGSTFKRPEGYYAGKLIMDAGLRGYQIGNAEVSEKHCGFVINKGGATASEIKTLISDVIQIVYDKYGVMLEPEVKFLGDF